MFWTLLSRCHCHCGGCCCHFFFIFPFPTDTYVIACVVYLEMERFHCVNKEIIIVQCTLCTLYSCEYVIKIILSTDVCVCMCALRLLAPVIQTGTDKMNLNKIHQNVK